MRTVKIGTAELTRLVVGSNPFSGFSHQGPQRDREMIRYYTAANIKRAIRKAEAAGINTIFARTDRHIMRLLTEYWDEGGTIQWFAQTATELADQIKAIKSAAAIGAKGAYVHGGQVDHWFANGKHDMLRKALEAMRECGLVAGLACHVVEAHEWIRDNLDPDFQMCSYYDPVPRTQSPHHVSTLDEKWDDEHRARMAKTIQTIPRPVVHYKILAGGNKPAAQAFAFLAGAMRPNDVACIGHYLKENEDLFAENVRTFDAVVEGAG